MMPGPPGMVHHHTATTKTGCGQEGKRHGALAARRGCPVLPGQLTCLPGKRCRTAQTSCHRSALDTGWPSLATHPRACHFGRRRTADEGQRGGGNPVPLQGVLGPSPTLSNKPMAPWEKLSAQKCPYTLPTSRADGLAGAGLTACGQP